jgi:hypothetical protein
MNGLLRQAAKFAAIGGGATAVHVLTALALNSLVASSSLARQLRGLPRGFTFVSYGQLVLDL